MELSRETGGSNGLILRIMRNKKGQTVGLTFDILCQEELSSDCYERDEILWAWLR